ncbi:selenocysteine insertion sequence-binding protein 2 isoform X4 [Vicugna pacos]|uniref:Selenocysteine insertion sequence-binding protein 2 isoform X4 n=1 Tax=Vicugna pacos TaxID=30538 RepID=A0ABM5CJE3_VICPA
MASEGPREPAGEGIKLSADVRPFVPKFAGLGVPWSESSEARVFPSCAATTYYPCVQELPVPEQKLCTEDTAFGASTFPAQYFPPEITLHPYAYPPYTLESPRNVCRVPGPQYDYSQPRCFGGFQTVKPRNEHMCPLPQNAKALFKKKAYEEQKFDSKKTDGPVSSDLQSVKASHMPIHAENSLKSDGYYKRTDRKSRIIEKSGSASKPEFEFTRLDFPELQGPENSERPETQKPPKWGPLHPAPTDISLLREVGKPAAASPEGEIVVKTNNPTESVTASAAASPSSCTRELSWTPMGYVVRQTLSTELSPAPKNVTSMINLKMVASSADPKNGSMSSSEVLSSAPSYREKHVAHPARKSKASQGGDPEQNEASRRNKKKKEKSKSKYEVLTVQEPPRIENNFKNSGKKSQIPVQLDLGGMLTALEKKQHSQNAKQSSRPVVFSGGSEESVSCAPVEESKSEEQPGAELQREAEARPRIHSRRFRDYCSQVLSKEVDACVTDLLKELVRFQDRMYQKDPVKAKAKRRLVLGLREVLKHLKLKKLKCVIISPNCEKIQSKGGLDDTLHSIIDHACEQNIPFVFALNRKALGRSLNKAVPVSVVGVFSYDGAQDQFHKMVELTMAARQSYKAMLENVHRELAAAPGPQAPASPPVQGPNLSTEDGPPAPAGEEEQCYIEIWRRHLEAYSRRALELETSLEASTSQMMNLNL